MKILNYSDKESWLAGRTGKITGSKLKNLIVKRGTGQKMGYYELIADRLSIKEEENPMDRGHRLEEEALDAFEKETGKEVDKSLVIWTRDDEENIAISPDGFIGDTEAVEVKCLNSATHIKSFLLQEIPDEYKEQIIQYFVVNDKLETLYFVFYDPRLIAKSFFYLTFKRENLEEKIVEYLEIERRILEDIESIVKKLSF